MKSSWYVPLLFVLFSLTVTMQAGTTTVVFQNVDEGGYQGTQDCWIDGDFDWPNGDKKFVQVLYELCLT